jgi:uncharacterized membrane protein (DUF106 family)
MAERETSDETPVFGMHFGDLGVIVIAAICTIAFILVLALPSPVAKYERMQAQAEQAQALAAKAQKKRDIEKAVASGVVDVGLVPSKP